MSGQNDALHYYAGPHRPARARVAVLQNSGEREHYSEASNTGLPSLEWVCYEFFDDTSLGAFAAGLEEDRFAAVVLASNSLHSGPVRDAVNGPLRDGLLDRICSGVGMVVLHQYVRPGNAIDLDFLPPEYRAILRGERLDIDANAVTWSASYRSTLRLLGREAALARMLRDEAWGQRPRAAFSRCSPLYPDAWEDACALSGEPLLLRSRGSVGRIAITNLPLDWLGAQDILWALVARAVRPSGHLYVHPSGERVADIATESLLAVSGRRRSFVHRQGMTSPAQLDLEAEPARHFSHLHLSPRWRWDQLEHLDTTSVRRRLENGGSVSAYADGPSQAGLLLSLDRRPAYLRRADGLRSRIQRHDPSMHDMFTALALARLSDAITQACCDREEVPAPLRPAAVARQLKPTVLNRLADQVHIDGQLLPSAAVVSTCRVLGQHQADTRAPGCPGIDGIDVPALQSWVDAAMLQCADGAVTDQIRLWLDLAPEGMALVVASGRPLTPAETFHLLLARRRGEPVLERLLSDLDEERSTPLHLATVAYWLALDGHRASRNGDQLLLQCLAQYRDALQRIADGPEDGDRLSEAVLLANAALILLEAHSVLHASSHVPSTGGRPAMTEEAEAALLRARESAAEAAELSRSARQQAQEWDDRAAAVRLLTDALVASLLGVALFAVIPAVWQTSESDARFAGIAAVVAVSGAVLALTHRWLKRLSIAGPLLSALSRLLARIRGQDDRDH